MLLHCFAAFALLFTVSLPWNAWMRTRFQSLLSKGLDYALSATYRYSNLQTGKTLPSLAYKFPNGQGNTEKFLQGRVNSAKWANQYGPIYRLWSGFSPEIVLTKPEHVEAVFRDSHTHIKAPANDSGELMNSLLGSCLGLISGPSWKDVKTAVELPFLHRSTLSYAADIQDFTKCHLSKLTSNSGTLGEHGLLHPVRDLKLLPFLFVAKTIYGDLTEGLQEELLAMIPPREALFRTVISGGYTRFWLSKFLPLPAIRSLHAFKSSWADWNDRAHTHALQVGHVAPIIGMYRYVQAGTCSREQLLQTLDEMLFANLDVTMGGLSWPLVFLAAHSKHQRLLRDEIRSHASGTSRTTYLLSSMTSNPTLLGATILESARLRPLAAFSVPQSAAKPHMLDGYQIPAGTKFVVDTYALNVRDPFWGKDREIFVPERWCDRLRDRKDLRYRYWRFGFGPRQCLGKYVAELMIRSVIVEIVENWNISLYLESMKEGKCVVGEDSEWPWDDETWIHHPDLWLKCDRVQG